MNKNAKLQRNFCCSFSRVSRYSLIGLLGVVLLSDAVGAKVGGLQNYSSKRSPEILLDKYRDNFPSLEAGDKQLLLKSYHNEQQIYIAQQPASTPSIPLNPEQQKLYEQGVKLFQEAEDFNKKGNREGYVQAINKYQQALKIIQELTLYQKEVEILVYIGGAYSAISENQTALAYLKQALEKSQQLKPLYKAGILGYIGLIYINIGRLDDGISYLKQAESIFLDQKKLEPDKLGVLASSYKSIALGYNRKGEPEKAFNYLEKALNIYRDVLKDPLGQAGVLEDIGFIHSLRGEISKAFEKYNQALAIFKKKRDLPAQAQILQHIASLHRKSGSYDQAIKNIEQARKLLVQVEGTVFKQGSMLFSIADIYRFLGDYQTAIKYYQQARILFEKAGDSTSFVLASLNIASTYKFSGDYQKALDFLDDVLKVKFDNKEVQSVILQDKGDIYALQSDYQKALDEYDKALKIQRLIPSPKAEANTLKKIALLYKSLGDYESSINNYNKALDTYKQIRDKPEQAIIYGFIGNVYETDGKYNESLKSYEQALLVLNQEDYINEELKLRRTLKNGTDEADALYNIAINQRNLGKLEAALSNIQTTINIVENIRGNVQSDELRTSYFATVQSYYKFYIDLLMQLHKKDPTKVCEFNIQDFKIKDRCDAVALHISERARARSLVELLKQARVNIREGIDPQLLIEESRLRSQIDVQEKRRLELASKEETKAQAARLNKEIENLLSQYRDLQTKISTSNPKYKALKYPTPLTFHQIQQQLDKDTILLQYSLGKERSYLWLVTPNSLQSYELVKEKEINTAAEDLYTLLKPRRMSGLPIEPTTEAASKLSQLILKPIAQQLGQKRLVIVADGALQYIPFAALADPDKLSKSSDYQPLMVNHEIVNLPSASTIAIQRQELQERKPAAKTLAILANPVFSKQGLIELSKKTPSDLESSLEQSELKRATRDLNLNDLKSLPETQKEADGIIALVTKEEERLSAFGTEEDGLLKHDCDTTGGSSGGPIIAWINQKPYIVALNNMEVKTRANGTPLFNLAVKISHIEQVLNGQ